jgi:hypothetical protein
VPVKFLPVLPEILKKTETLAIRMKIGKNQNPEDFPGFAYFPDVPI